MKSPGVLTGLLAAALLVSVSGRFCQYPPTWRTTSDVQPMLNTRGKVTVVALLLATWPMCQHQAAGLETIRQEYIAQGRTEISFMIVNSKEVPEQIGQLSSRTNFPVYQDTNATNIWNKLNGGKDDVLIYDRCGKLVYFIPFPSSLLRYHLTDWAIRTAYDTDPCGCQRSIRRSRRRRRRHNHERHSHRSGSNAIVVGMGRSAVRDMNRTPNWTGNRWNRPIPTHKVIRKLWNIMKKHYRNQRNKRAWVCPSVSSDLENNCACRQAFFPERLGLCSCEELGLTVVQECVWFNWDSFLRRHSFHSEIARPNWEFLTDWPCDFHTTNSSATCRWPLDISDNSSWQWLTEETGVQVCSWPRTEDTCSWRKEGDNVSWQWPNQQVCKWSQSSGTWQCSTKSTSSPWRWQNNESGTKTWQWDHLSGNCMWQCITSDSGELSWNWPIGETVSAVIRWQSTQSDERWQWQTTTTHVEQCQWTSPRSNSPTWRCQRRWQWHSEGPSLNWHWSGQHYEADVCTWPSSGRRSTRTWQCHTVGNDWQWQGLTSSGQTWEESRQDGQLWPWRTKCQWQVGAWRWRDENDGHGIWLWHHASQSWRWQNSHMLS